MIAHDERDLEAMATALEASGYYRVLRRMPSRSTVTDPDGSPTKLGLFVDVETTGLDPTKDEIIELAMVPFSYSADGRVFQIGGAFHRLRQPSIPIPPEITAITGIDDEMVRGCVIDPMEVVAFAVPAAVVVAHNAAFDRRFLERLSEVFTTKPWACSMSQVDWAAQGFEGVKLAYLATACGLFYDRHRAPQDCVAAIELLARPLPRAEGTGLARLLETARRSSWRIWAENSPYDLKDVLKARGYLWNGEGGASPRAWYIDVDEDRREAEIAFLQSEIYLGEVRPLIKQITAFDRFSDRV